MLTIANLIDYLDQFAPPDLAAEWDNVGLLLGDRAWEVKQVMTCLTLTSEVAREAIKTGAQLIVTHHPILFRPVQRLTTDNIEGKTLLALIKAGVAVYSPHTAFDNTKGGINDLLAGRLGLIEVGPLRRREGPGQCKIIVFVPDADLGKVADALYAAGAGNIGDYRECGFRLAGIGTFFGSDAANPTIGKKGRREEVSEWRLEVVCPQDKVNQVVAAMRKAHSYEEPAFDVYPLRPVASPLGEGRVGRLPRPMPLRDLAQIVKTNLHTGMVQVVGDPARTVERVALACGAAGEFLKDALRVNADVFLTGETRFHDNLSAQAQGLALLLPGHYATERFGIEELAGRLKAKWPELVVWASREERDPVGWM